MHKPRFLDQLAMELGDPRPSLSPSPVDAARFNRNTSRQNGRAIAPPTSVTSSSKSRSTSMRKKFPAPRLIDCPRSPARSIGSNSTPRNWRSKRCACGGEPATFETADDKLRIALPRALKRGRGNRDRDRLCGSAAPRTLFCRPRRRLSEQAAPGVDAGRGRGFALLVSMLRLPEQPAHQRNHRDGARKIHRGFQRRA